MNITLPRAVIEQAVEALEEAENVLTWDGFQKAADALRTALGQQYMTNAVGELELVTIVQTGVGIGNQQPVAWMLKSGHGTEFNECIAEELKALTWKGKPMWTPLYTAPPQRKPLSDEEIQAFWEKAFDSGSSPRDFARAIEAAHGITEES